MLNFFMVNHDDDKENKFAVKLMNSRHARDEKISQYKISKDSKSILFTGVL